MIVNQWVPAAHRGDAVGDSARRVRGLLRAMGHESDLFALTIDDDLAGDVRPFTDAAARQGQVTVFHYALPSPMTDAFAGLTGVRILQYHNVTPAHYFARFDPALFRLAVLGRRELATLANAVDLALGARHVHFIGHVSDEELVAFYDVADVFLCASEHEGFCVPIVEAFYKQVPVIAYAATAVPATMDGAGVLFDDKDPMHVAALIDAVVSNASLQEAIVASQLDAVERLQARDFSGTLLHLIGRVLACPRAAAPRVAFDFWQQFDAAQELEELRLYRPSIYKALPVAP